MQIYKVGYNRYKFKKIIYNICVSMNHYHTNHYGHRTYPESVFKNVGFPLGEKLKKVHSNCQINLILKSILAGGISGGIIGGIAYTVSLYNPSVDNPTTVGAISGGLGGLLILGFLFDQSPSPSLLASSTDINIDTHISNGNLVCMSNSLLSSYPTFLTIDMSQLHRLDAAIIHFKE